jgi:hypothetical protein
MRRSLTLSAFLAILSLPALANGLSGMGEAIHGNGFSFGKPNLKTVPVDAVRVGDFTVDIQHTLLSEVVKQFGGTLRAEGEDSAKATWVCYSVKGKTPANVWFISNALGGFEFVMMVAAELNPKPASECDAAPANFTLPDFGVPGLGAKTDDIKKAFGAASGSSGRISFRADEPGADALGTSLNAQYLGYLVKGGTVVGIGVGETSVAPPAQ